MAAADLGARLLGAVSHRLCERVDVPGGAVVDDGYSPVHDASSFACLLATILSNSHDEAEAPDRAADSGYRNRCGKRAYAAGLGALARLVRSNRGEPWRARLLLE